MKFKNIQNNTTTVGSIASVAIKNTESLWLLGILCMLTGALSTLNCNLAREHLTVL